MQSGRLRDRVTLSNPTRTDDGEGGAEVEYAEGSPARLPAEVRSLRAAERVHGEALEAIVSHVVTLRYHADVHAQTRLTWGSRVLEVVGPPVELEHGRVLECACVERFL